MPITTGIQIIIALAGYVDQPAPSSQYLAVNQTIRLMELPSTDSAMFSLLVSEGISKREARLSAAESQQLTTLLTQLPPQSMAAGVVSFDGIMYELMVIQAEQPLVFHWQNDDWRYDPNNPVDKWQRVAAVADYVLKLVKDHGGQ